VLNYFLRMKKSIVPLLAIVLAAGSLSARAQVVPAAARGQLSLTVGGLASAFQPDYDAAFNGKITERSPYYLYGVGTYVDVKFSRWIQIEGEARWLRYNQFDVIHQDNYLIGPRIPIHRFNFLRSTVYAKGLVGYAKMSLGYAYVPNVGFVYIGNGGFTDIAMGGGVDIKLTKRISIRAFDAEYQYYPKFIENTHLIPYGASVGVGYKIF
jgi:hypothetical protein